MFHLGRRRVRAPSGVEWCIGRCWISRGLPRWRKIRVGKPSAETTGEAALLGVADVGSLEDLGAGLAIIAVILVVAVVVIPLLLFGIELIIVGLLIAAGILGRGLLGRPWVVQASPADGAGQARAWRVVGWCRSGRLIDEVAASLADGLEPAPAEAAERHRG